jgi:rhodanese-related sulfurtransferase
MSRDDAEKFIAGPNDVCISIRTPGAEPADLSPNFREVLRLYFHDLGGFPEPWPADAEQLTAEQAESIVQFALRHRQAQRLIVHCEAGISRSVAVALALSTELAGYWAFPRWYTPEWRGDRFVHNRYVFDLVVGACKRATATAEVQS